MAYQDMQWDDIVLESYVVRSKLEKLLVDRARAQRMNVKAEDFEVQVCILQ